MLSFCTFLDLKAYYCVCQAFIKQTCHNNCKISFSSKYLEGMDESLRHQKKNTYTTTYIPTTYNKEYTKMLLHCWTNNCQGEKKIIVYVKTCVCNIVESWYLYRYLLIICIKNLKVEGTIVSRLPSYISRNYL